MYDTYKILFSGASHLVALWHEFDHLGSEDRAVEYAARQFVEFLKAGYMFHKAELYNVTTNEYIATIEGEIKYKKHKGN